MNRSISLNGTWETAFCEVNSGTLEKITQMPVIPYAVPGDIHTALMEAGLIEEPLEGMNDFACRWVEDKEFWCRRAFDWMFTANRRVFLTFEGLDCTADIYLNGQFIGRQNNAFVEAEYEVTPFLRPGRNELLVRIDPGLAEAQKHPLEQMGLMWNNEQPYRVWMRKPQFVYGWDWTIWLCSCGIWKNVYLTECSEARLTDLYAAPLPEPLKENEPCEVSVFFETDKWAESGCSAEISLRDRENSRIAHAETAIAGGGQILRLVVPQAHLWWCNGFGEPYLYTVTVELKNEAGLILDEKTQRLGLRSVQLAEPDLGNGETGFTFALNGQPVFCKGANHVPCDCLPGRILPEKERQLVTLARDAHMNMLRIWGGGVYASEPLMNACDEMGVLVWHDFMYACGYYPDHNPAFVENITEETRKAIRRLRRHASLVGWAGNNEIQEMYASQRQTHPDLPWYGGSIYERILPALVEEMCPGMIYRASSPLGGNKQADARHGDQHIWLLTHVDSHPHYLDLWHFTDFPVKFLSEFGVMGAMTLETAQSCIPPEHLFPDDPVWLHHTNSCQDHTLLKRLVERYFGPCGEMSAGQFILRSQALQAEITRHMYEEFRRQKFTCSGLLF